MRLNEHIAQHDPIKYPMAGRGSERVTVGIYDSQSGDTLSRDRCSCDRYFTNIAWSPDSKYLYIDEVERSQSVTHLREHEVASGQMERTLLSEQNSKYIDFDSDTLSQ